MNDVIGFALNWFSSLGILQLIIILVGALIFLIGIVKIFRKAIGEGVLVALFALVYTALFLCGFNVEALMVKHLLIIFAVVLLLFVISLKIKYGEYKKIIIFVGIVIVSSLLGSYVFSELIEANEMMVMYYSVLIPAFVYQLYAVSGFSSKKAKKDSFWVDTSPSDIATTWNPNHK